MWSTRDHPAIRGRWLQAVARAIAWEAAGRVRKGPRDLSWNGFRLRCYPGDHAANEMIYYDGLPDYHEMRFMQHYLRPGDNFLDVGANEGMYTVMAAALVGRQGHVDAIEPLPRNLERLRGNIAVNGFDWVSVKETAAGAEEGTIRFVAEGPRSRIAGSGGGAPGQQELEVPIARLDSLVGDRSYAMGKMDIEGAEPLAFQGAGALTAAHNPPVWLLEFYGHFQRYGYTDEQFATMLADLGYDLATYDSESRTLNFMSAAAIAQPQSRHATNVLAVARFAREDVLTRVRA
jgi:FkbM family methyltransferase